jgi:hypothetical protein
MRRTRRTGNKIRNWKTPTDTSRTYLLFQNICGLDVGVHIFPELAVLVIVLLTLLSRQESGLKAQPVLRPSSFLGNDVDFKARSLEDIVGMESLADEDACGMSTTFEKLGMSRCNGDECATGNRHGGGVGMRMRVR